MILKLILASNQAFQAFSHSLARKNPKFPNRNPNQEIHIKMQLNDHAWLNMSLLTLMQLKNINKRVLFLPLARNSKLELVGDGGDRFLSIKGREG